MQRKMLEDIKKTVVFIGKFQMDGNQNQISNLSGTGLLLNIDGIICLVTAKHVVCELDDKGKVIEQYNDLWFFNNGKDDNQKVIATSINESYKRGATWLFHNDESIDLALIPFPVDTSISDIKTYPQKLFLPLSEVYETNEIFFISFQPGISNIEQDNQIKPVVRKGIIARINGDETIYIDGSVFPGNSGSPVFMLPEAARFTDTGISIGTDNLGGRFVGIVGSYLPYQDVAISLQTKRPRIIFEENTGLSKVWPAKFIDEISQSEEFKMIVKKASKK